MNDSTYWLTKDIIPYRSSMNVMPAISIPSSLFLRSPSKLIEPSLSSSEKIASLTIHYSTFTLAPMENSSISKLDTKEKVEERFGDTSIDML